MAATVPGILLTGVHGSRPSSGVSVGTLYSCTTHGLVYQTSDTGSTWGTWATLGVGDATAHIADASDAHDASAVSVLDSGANFAGTDVEAVLSELQDNIDAVSVTASAVGEGVGLVTANTTVTTGATTTLDITTEDDDDDGWHQTATTAITGTVTKTLSSLTLTGSGTSFLSELAAGSVLSVPGTATEILAVRSIQTNTSLTLWNTPANTASGQTATRKREYIVVPEGKTGRYLLTVTASLGVEATPTHSSVGQLAQQTNSVTVTGVVNAAGTPNANSNGATFGFGRRLTMTEGGIYLFRGINNNSSSVDIQVFFTANRVA